jgi:hypothetical protein
MLAMEEILSLTFIIGKNGSSDHLMPEYSN